MAQRARTIPLALGPGAVAVLISGVTVGWLVFGVASAARRPLGWALASAVVAVVIAPLVAHLDRHLPRLLALLAVFVGIGAGAGALTLGVLRDLDNQVGRLKQAAPEAAAELAGSGGTVGDAAAELDLEGRVRSLVEELERPSSGVAAGVASSAGAWLVGLVLTAFLLSWGPRLASAALRQIRDDDLRERTGWVLRTAVGSGRRYVLGALALAAVTGMVTWVLCTAAGVPAPLALATVTAGASLLPVVGVVVGGAPAVLLEAGLGSGAEAIGLMVAFAGLQVVHALVLRRVVAPRSLVVGPAVLLIALVLGYDGYGVGGACFGAVLAVFGVAALDAAGQEAETEMAPAPAPASGP